MSEGWALATTRTKPITTGQRRPWEHALALDSKRMPWMPALEKARWSGGRLPTAWQRHRPPGASLRTASSQSYASEPLDGVGSGPMSISLKPPNGTIGAALDGGCSTTMALLRSQPEYTLTQPRPVGRQRRRHRRRRQFGIGNARKVDPLLTGQPSASRPGGGPLRPRGAPHHRHGDHTRLDHRRIGFFPGKLHRTLWTFCANTAWGRTPTTMPPASPPSPNLLQRLNRDLQGADGPIHTIRSLCICFCRQTEPTDLSPKPRQTEPICFCRQTEPTGAQAA